MGEPIWIASAELSAGIDPFGAELTHLRDLAGRELMTDADPTFWTGHAPILFPVIGLVNGGVIRVDGVEYPMPKHGFARHSAFELARRDSSSAAFVLSDSIETRASYPFEFQLEIAFSLDGPTLSIEAKIDNCGDTPMPAQFGFHPAFAWPLPYGESRADHRIHFAADEPEPLSQLCGDGLISHAKRESPINRRMLHLADAVFEADALILDPVRSQAVSYGATRGPQLAIAFPDTPRLGIWTKPGAHFVCIEPWHGIADPQGFIGDFRTKPGVFEIAPGEDKRIAMSVTLAP